MEIEIADSAESTAGGLSTKEKILTAAEKEFFQNGFAGARTVAIAKRAGVTHAMLHYYFRTKEHLFDKVLENRIGSMRDVMLTSMGDSSIPLFDKIKSGVEQHIDFLAANPDFPKFMVNEVFSRPERLPKMFDKVKAEAPESIKMLQRQIDEYAQQGLCRKTDAVMLLLDIISLDVFLFLAAPMMKAIIGEYPNDEPDFIERRKAEIIDTIMRKLKP